MLTCAYPGCCSKRHEKKSLCIRHHTLVHVLLPEMKDKKKHKITYEKEMENAKKASAHTILGFFLKAISDPSYKMCRDRLMREFQEGI